MQYRRLGRTGLTVSTLGFGCGAVGGLLVRGERQEMAQVVARAVELGVTYFDTAASYGDGASEANLGRVLEELKPAVLVGTKVQLAVADLPDVERVIVESAERSLRRLRRETVDLFQLHNPLALGPASQGLRLGSDDLARVVAAFQKLQRQGKIRFWGLNGLGETAALHQALSTIPTGSMQCCYNLINPSAGMPVPDGFAYPDVGQLIDVAATHQVGVIAIRVLAGGALSGSLDRHVNAAGSVDPIATGQHFADDVRQAQRFQFLIREGYADSLVDAAIRFVVGKPEVSTALVGISSMGQLEQAAASVGTGPLPVEALDRLRQAWATAVADG